MKKMLLVAIFYLPLIVVYAQTSSTTIIGTGITTTSAHITIGTGAYFCPDEYIIEDGSSLTTSDPSAICSATIADQVISGIVKDKNNIGVSNVAVVFSNGGSTVKTNASGFYNTAVPFGWSGTSTPSKVGYWFEPTNYTYNNVNANKTDQDFAAKAKYVLISGHVLSSNSAPVEGATIEFSNSGLYTTTNAEGYYEQFITEGWTGTATPSKPGLVFTPEQYTYSHVLGNQNNQDYTAESQYAIISGYIKDTEENPLESVIVDFSNSGQSTTTDNTGYYELFINKGWSGIATPSLTDYSFEPNSYSYSSISSNQPNQNFVANDLTLAINDNNAIPENFTVLPAYPNPFNPTTTITYGLDKDSKVFIQIYDIRGNLITTLLNTEQQQGWYNIEWSGNDRYNKQVPAGLYISKITSGNNTKTSKLMLLK